MYEGVAGTHQWYDGTPHPWEFKRVWHLEPSLTDPDTVYAGVEDAAMFRTTDGGNVDRTSRPARARLGAAVGAGRRRHVPAHDPSRSDATRADVHRHLRRRAPFAPTTAARRGGRSTAGCSRSTFPIPTAEVGHCVHRIAMHPSRPDVLFMQKHWDVMRSDNAGESWREVSGNLPTDFGFPIDVHAHEPETIYVVPIKSDSEHYPPDGKLRVYRSRTGGNEWEAADQGSAAARLLRQRAARRDGGGRARSVRRLFRHDGRTGVRLGRRRRQLDADRARPAGGALGGSADAADDSRRAAVSSAHARARRRRGAGGGRRARRRCARSSTRSRRRYPVLRGTIRDHVTLERRPFLRFFACETDLSHEPPDTPLPDAVTAGREPLVILGAIAGGAAIGDA